MGNAQLVDEEMHARWSAAQPFALTGIACVVAGGLVAAVTSPLGLEMGSWTAAYLVLVAGVAQLGLGVGQAWIPEELPTARRRLFELTAWNGGGVAVLVATFIRTPLLVAAGGLALLIALGLFLSAVKRPRRVTTHWLATYRVLAIVVAISVLVGFVLSVARHAS